MIYRDGHLWDGWRDDLKSTHGAKFQLKKPAEFTVIDAYRTTKKIDRTLVPVFANLQIPVEYTWADQEGTRHAIKYAKTSQKRVIGKETIDHTMPRRLPMKGTMYVPKDDLELYWFMINHPMCGTARRFNPEEKPKGVGVRDAQYNLASYGTQIVYKELNRERELESQVDLDKMLTKAKFLLYDTVREGELRNIYAFYNKNNSSTTDPNEIRLFLKNKIEGKPTDNSYASGAHEFISILEDKGRAIKGTVIQAQQLGVIEFVKGQRTWMMEGNPICQVPKVVNEVKGICEWIEKNDTGEVLEAIQKGVTDKEKSRKAELVT